MDYDRRDWLSKKLMEEQRIYSKLYAPQATTAGFDIMIDEFTSSELPHYQVVVKDLISSMVHSVLTPKRILRSGPATIVFWQDGTKTIVKLSEGEEDNAYAAFTAALGVKIFGSNSKLKKMVQTKTEEQK